jgi:hypothetical protein
VNEAWPFLVGRAKHAGHRVVVAPDYMTASAIQDLGKLARGETGPGEAFIAEGSLGPGGTRATAVFRVFRALHADYFGAGDEPLTDRGGREIRMTEGIVMPVPRAEAERLGLTAGDLEAAHRSLESSFRDFWREEDGYPLQRSTPVAVTGRDRGGPALALRPSGSPQVATGDPVPPPSPVAIPAVTSMPAAAPAGQGARYPRYRLAGEERSRGRVIAIIAIAATTAFAVVLGAYLILSPPPGRDVATTLAQMCTALDAGKIDRAYALTTPAFRAKTTQATFGTELTQGTGQAESCRPASTTGKATGLVSITTASGVTQSWTVALSRSGSTWEINSLSPASGLR